MKINIKPCVARPLAISLTIFALFVSSLAPTSNAQQRRGARTGKAGNATAPSSSKRNPEIARIVAEINASNIERTIRKLVSFGTRNTLSVQDNPTRGIGAARDWLHSEFPKVAENSGRRMTVAKQT